MKKYLLCTITRYDGGKFENPLKLSESYLIVKMAKEHSSVNVSIAECTKEQYKAIFG